SGLEDKSGYHMTLLARDVEGYRNLLELVTRAHLDGFYYKPRIDKELLAQHAAGLSPPPAVRPGRSPAPSARATWTPPARRRSSTATCSARRTSSWRSRTTASTSSRRSPAPRSSS